MAHLGARAFEEIGGEVVQTTAFVLTNQHIDGYAGTYARLVDANTQDAKEELYLSGAERYIARQENFEKIPGMPIAYWVSDNSFSIFENNNTFCKFAETRAGMITGNNDIFVRLWFEVSNIKSYYNCESRQNAASSGKKWFSYSKGGAYRKWYGNHDCVVNWYNDGYDMMHREDSNGNIPAHAFNLEYIFKKNICWNSLSSKMFSARYTEKGFLYDAGGSFASIYDDRELFFLALLNSSVAFYWLTALNPTMNFQKGNIGNIPVIMDGTQLSQIEKLTKENISISRADWDAFETSWDFESHPLVPMAYERREQLSYGIHAAERKKAVTLLAERYKHWEWDCSYRFSKLKENEEELNRIFIDIYGLAEELTPEVEDRDVTVRRIFDTKEEIPASMKGSNYAITKADVMKSLISYAVGCMFGRYSLDTPGLAYAGGRGMRRSTRPSCRMRMASSPSATTNISMMILSVALWRLSRQRSAWRPWRRTCSSSPMPLAAGAVRARSSEATSSRGSMPTTSRRIRSVRSTGSLTAERKTALSVSSICTAIARICSPAFVRTTSTSSSRATTRRSST